MSEVAESGVKHPSGITVEALEALEGDGGQLWHGVWVRANLPDGWFAFAVFAESIIFGDNDGELLAESVDWSAAEECMKGGRSGFAVVDSWADLSDAARELVEASGRAAINLYLERAGADVRGYVRTLAGRSLG